MQMKTRSTTRAEAARRKVSTRAQVKAAMAPPLARSDLAQPALVYKHPKERQWRLDARVLAAAPSLGLTQKTSLLTANGFITANKKGNLLQLIPSKRPRPCFEDSLLDVDQKRPKKRAMNGHEMTGGALQGGLSGTSQAMAAMTPWSSLSLFSEE